MNKVSHLSGFPKSCNIAMFYAKTYDLAVVEANKSPLKFGNYFEQPHFGGSKNYVILCSYVKEN